MIFLLIACCASIFGVMAYATSRSFVAAYAVTFICSIIGTILVFSAPQVPDETTIEEQCKGVYEPPCLDYHLLNFLEKQDAADAP